MRRCLWVLPLLMILQACGDFGDDPTDPDEQDDPIEPPTPTVSYATDVQPIFDASCVGCHGAGGNAGLDLRAGSSHGNLVEVVATESSLLRVDPGSPPDSWLYLKMTGQHDVGDMMPPGGGLGSDTIDLVRVWIEEGALDN